MTSHSHTPTRDFAAANAAHFDALSANPSATHGHGRVHGAIVASLLTVPSLTLTPSTRVLDYACGSGAISRLLLPHVGSVVGYDVSAGQVGLYNAAADNQGLTRDEMWATTSLSEVDGGFDLAVCVLAFHHMENPAEVARGSIAARLLPGGWFVLVDFFKHEDFLLVEGMEHVVAHNGFEREEVETWFREAGLGEPEWVEVGRLGEGGKGWTLVKGADGEVLKKERRVFMAIGKKI